jgi:hypothetical protein
MGEGRAWDTMEKKKKEEKSNRLEGPTGVDMITTSKLGSFVL